MADPPAAQQPPAPPPLDAAAQERVNQFMAELQRTYTETMANVGRNGEAMPRIPPPTLWDPKKMDFRRGFQLPVYQYLEYYVYYTTASLTSAMVCASLASCCRSRTRTHSSPTLRTPTTVSLPPLLNSATS